MATKKCTTCGKTRKMAKGGNPCPEGTYWAEDGSCKPIAKQPGLLAGPSVKIAGAIIGAGLAGMGRVLSADKRADKKAAKKVVNTATKTLADKKIMKKGGAVKDKNWIQKAVNPAHKGYCTPMSKPTCTPKRKALAKTFKAMAKKK